MAVLVAAVTLGILLLAWRVLAAGGWTAWEALILGCIALNAPWLGLSAATGLVGLALRLGAADPAAAVLPALRRRPPDALPPPRGRTLLAACVRLEAMETVLPPLERLLKDLRAGPGGEQFTLAILSDTPAGEAAGREAAAVARVAARCPPGAVLYRRRPHNAGYKAGNLMEFLDREAGRFDHALVLDADSSMSAGAVRRLVAVMEADPRLGILQSSVSTTGADTPLAQVLGFGHRHAARIWALGQAWWQGPEGPYWGHNALLRIAPFRQHCRLDPLPDGSAILSHDHVEAARLHAAGWAVRVWPDDLGSAERHPPDLAAMLHRDLRWAEGNFQWRHLLRRRDLGRIGRLQMLQGILHYALAPASFALLPLAALNAATGGGEGTPRGALLALLLLGLGALLLPKLAGYAEALLRSGAAARLPLLRHMGQELLLTLLLDPLAALDRSVTVLRVALGRRGGWTPQPREGRGLSLGEALRRFGPHSLAGLALLAGFAAAGPFPTLAALPFLAGLLLAVPIALLTGRPGARRRPWPAGTGSAAGQPGASP
ncbi:glucans biosynthesis glucosyltransferase MdoH [Roseicella aquatilis]|uniref:Glucans biosynthesis glucosyltransferase H n=1 Tax=Roseicella aquatilis TaxID=2527868 RepID=A0A4R4DW81_9PROT|nr:glucans biosynthesis glucosyltransferase MdoH [Roseicella aquatilis]TCZ64951.1 glucans biosynthesis glucosyltransferase MdoH [Roseicella aquatilis]